MKVLIVDDNPAGRKILRYNFNSRGCEVIEAGDGEEGIEMATAHRPDLIISDALMPRMDGFQFLRKVKGDEALREIPFIFYTSVFTSHEDEELALSLGAATFIVKPKKFEELWHEICIVVEGHEEPEEVQGEVAVGGEEEYLTEYSHVMIAKIEEKVTELEQANLEIRQQMRNYCNLFNSIRDVIVVIDFNRTIIDVNQPALRENFGYELEEVLGENSRILYAGEEEYYKTEILEPRESGNGKIVKEVCFKRKNGETFIGEFCGVRRLDEDGVPMASIAMIRDISERKRAEEALRNSEERRIQLQTEVALAADVQAKLLPCFFPAIPGFEIVARCLPAHSVGGDFYDWQEVAPGTLALTFGDVMGNGMAAAMLMATVRATIRAETFQNSPATALEMAEQVLKSDLENSESFVTLFHARLNVPAQRLTYVDCGHGLVFVRRADGTIEDLQLRGLPLGVATDEPYQEGVLNFHEGDVLVLYSDGLIEAWPEQSLNNRLVGAMLDGARDAMAMLEMLAGIPAQNEPLSDDLTMLVVRCTGGRCD
ncbi:MAG: SpoIIE family protein phosphatase [Geobacter sp.]|nr:SpoIIE family protein phosphatase [Geobacter sp.]